MVRESPSCGIINTKINQGTFVFKLIEDMPVKVTGIIRAIILRFEKNIYINKRFKKKIEQSVRCTIHLHTCAC